jgi:regulatory protein
MTSTPSSTERAAQIEQICLRLLARREHSQRELLNKLKLRGFECAETQVVIDALAQQSWQSEQRFSDSLLRQRLAQGYGPLRIAYDLQRSGIRDCDVDQAAQQQGGWLELALQAYRRRYDEQRQLAPREWQKRQRFLQQRGFTPAVIRQLYTELGLRLLNKP